MFVTYKKQKILYNYQISIIDTMNTLNYIVKKKDKISNKRAILQKTLT